MRKYTPPAGALNITNTPVILQGDDISRGRFYLSLTSPMNSIGKIFDTAAVPRVKRLAITRVKANVCLFSVHSGNNVVYWTCSFNPGDDVYSNTVAITIPSGIYTPAELVTVFVSAFTAQVNPGIGRIRATQVGTTGLYELYTYRGTEATPLPSAFINSYMNTISNDPALAVKNGASTALNQPWGLGLGGIDFSDRVPNPNPSFNAYHWMLPRAYGARYFDICSRELTRDSVTMNPDLSAPNDSLARVFIESNFPHEIDKTWDDPLNWVVVNDRSLNNIDLRLVLDNKYEVRDAPNNTSPSFPFNNVKEISRINVEIEILVEY